MIIKDIFFKKVLKTVTDEFYVGYKMTAPFVYTVYTIDENTGLYSIWDIKHKNISLLEHNFTKNQMLFYINILKYKRGCKKDD